MSFSFPEYTKWEEGKIYNNLPEEEKELIKQEAIEKIKMKNPSVMNPKIAYTRNLLLQIEIIELIRKKYPERCCL